MDLPCQRPPLLLLEVQDTTGQAVGLALVQGQALLRGPAGLVLLAQFRVEPDQRLRALLDPLLKPAALLGQGLIGAPPLPLATHPRVHRHQDQGETHQGHCQHRGRQAQVEGSESELLGDRQHQGL